ncbi:MAG: cell envelope integrity protein TolA [Magnetococcales bacterium]|nr:cell envelope integrity protein TolA [Magnetococcales bacterium]
MMLSRASLTWSLLIHLAILMVAFFVPMTNLRDSKPPVMAVDLIQLPPAKKAPPPKTPPTQAKQTTRPEPPKPAPPKPPVPTPTPEPMAVEEPPPPPKPVHREPPPPPDVVKPVVKPEPVKPPPVEKPLPKPEPKPEKAPEPVKEVPEEKPLIKPKPIVEPGPKKKPPEKPVKPEPVEKVEKPTKPEKVEKVEKPTKPEKVEKVEKTDKTAAKNDSAKKSEKTDDANKKKPALDFSKAIAKYADKVEKEVPAESQDDSQVEQPEPSVSPTILARWQRNITTTVRNNWSKPNGLVNENKLEVKLRVKVGPDGSLLDATIEHSSGNKGFDGSVLRAISKTRTVDPPPQGCTECRELEFTFKPME